MARLEPTSGQTHLEVISPTSSKRIKNNYQSHVCTRSIKPKPIDTVTHFTTCSALSIVTSFAKCTKPNRLFQRRQASQHSLYQRAKSTVLVPGATRQIKTSVPADHDKGLNLLAPSCQTSQLVRLRNSAKHLLPRSTTRSHVTYTHDVHNTSRFNDTPDRLVLPRDRVT